MPTKWERKFDRMFMTRTFKGEYVKEAGETYAEKSTMSENIMGAYKKLKAAETPGRKLKTIKCDGAIVWIEADPPAPQPQRQSQSPP